MQIDVSEFEELEIVVGHDCGPENEPEPYAATEGRFEMPGLLLLKCENCGEEIPVGVGTDQPAIVEQVTAYGEHEQTEEARGNSSNSAEDEE